MRRTYAWWLVVAVIALLAAGLTAQDNDTQAPPEPTPLAEEDGGADDVMEKMVERLEAPTADEPGKRPEPERPSTYRRQERELPDPEIIGVAPDSPRPKLRREGEFVVSRRGRIRRSGDGRQALFVFDSDSKQAGDPPMVLVPCRMLETIEEFIERRGDRIVFVLSGQVLTYRGVNYLLPTMMKLATDRGNLDH